MMSPAATFLSLAQSFRVALEVRVVIAEAAGRIELVDRRASGFACEQLGDRSGVDRPDRRMTRCQNVHGAMPAGSGAAMRREAPFHFVYVRAVDRQAESVAPQLRDWVRANHRHVACGRRTRAVCAVRRIGPDLAHGRRWSLARPRLRSDEWRRPRSGFSGPGGEGRMQQPPCDGARIESANQSGNDPAPAPSFRAHLNTTRVPAFTSDATRAASQFVSRTQPCDCAWPIRLGSGVP